MSWLCATLWTVACHTLLSMEFSTQEYWSGLPFLLQGIFPTQGSNSGLLRWQVDSLPLVSPGKPVDRCSNLLYSLVISLCHLHDPRVEGTEDTHSRGDSGVLELLLAPWSQLFSGNLPACWYHVGSSKSATVRTFSAEIHQVLWQNLESELFSPQKAAC